MKTTLVQSSLFGGFRHLLLGAIIFSMSSLFSACDDVFLESCDRVDEDIVIQDFALANFNQIRLYADADVYLSNSSTPSVTIEGPSNVVNAVTLGVSNNTWDIDLDRCLRGSYNLKIYVSAPNIENIEVFSSGTVESLETLQAASQLNLKLSGSGNIKLSIDDTPQVFSIISGSGNISLEGDTQHHDIHITGSGNLSSYQLYTDSADVSLSGSGNAYVFVKDLLDVGISGSGSVFYKGFPDLSASISGSGGVIDSN